MDAAIASVIVAVIMGVASIITAIIWGYVPRHRKEELKNRRKELHEVYTAVQELKKLEDYLENKYGISKQTARKEAGVHIADKFSDKKVSERIEKYADDAE